MKSKKLSGHLLSDLTVLCSCILSHPLYLSYFLFFSPYLVKLLAFLSPLFIATTLLLLSLLTSFHHDTSTYSTLLENLVQERFDRTGYELDESTELEGFEEFEVYKIVFGSPTFDLVSEFSQDKEEEKGVLISDDGVFLENLQETPVEFPISDDGGFLDNLQESPVEFPIGEEEEEKILGVLISDEGGFPTKGGEKSDGFARKRQDDERSDVLLSQETSKCEKLTSGIGKAGEWKQTMADKDFGQVLTLGNGKPLEVIPSSINGGNQTQQRPLIKTHSTGNGEAVWNTNDGHNTNKIDLVSRISYPSSRSLSHSQPIRPSLSDLGSMRKEKDWRRTLACKLFEERHNAGGTGGSDGSVGGVEGMDLLWETYEKTEESRGKLRIHGRKKEKKMKKGRVADYVQEYGDADEDEDQDEVDNGQLCCLQALKFSAGKMNFGRPGFLKISKAIKGIGIGVGWLNHHNNHRQQYQHSGGSRKGKSS